MGPLLVSKPLLVIQTTRRLTNTGNGDGDEKKTHEFITRSHFVTRVISC